MWNSWLYVYEAERPRTAAELRAGDARAAELARELAQLTGGPARLVRATVSWLRPR